MGMPDDEDSAMAGVKVHDMIVMVNGKTVGGMTEVGLELELETSGPILLLTVSRYKHAKAAAKQFAAMERQMLQVMDSAARDTRLLGWQEIGNADTLGSMYQAKQKENADSRKVDDAIEAEAPSYLDDAKASPSEDVFFPVDDTRSISDGETSNRVDGTYANASSLLLVEQKILTRELHAEEEEENGYSSGSESVDYHRPRTPVNKSDDASSEHWEKDENVCMGCVCGRIHSKDSRSNEVFWIQCESCEAWYDVSKNCVGFTMQQAKSIDRWTCWACPESESMGTPQESRTQARDSPEPKSATKLVLSSSAPKVSTSDSNSQSMSRSMEEKAETNGLEFKTTEKSSDRSRRLSIQERTTLDGSLLPSSKPFQLEGGTFRKPTGPIPAGRAWDRHRGLWVPEKHLPSQKQVCPIQSKVASSSKKIDDRRRNRRRWTERKEFQGRITPEGFLLPASKPIQLEDGTFKQPGGVPAGGVWDSHRGVWAPENWGKPGTTQDEAEKNKASSVQSNEGPSVIDESEPSVLSTQSHSTDAQKRKKPRVEKELISGSGDVHVIFEKGDMVFVESHAWPNRNVLGGIAHIVESYLDGDGDWFYNVKYVIGGSDKGIDAEFVGGYSFN
jgi:hypothetical protein